MISDLREQQPITEQRSPGGYIHLVQEGDPTETYTEDNFDYIIFPKKRMGNIGDVKLCLRKDNNREDLGRKNLLLSGSGMKEISLQDIQEQGYYLLEPGLENPDVRFRGSQFFLHVSLDGQTDLIKGQFYNDSEYTEVARVGLRQDHTPVEGTNFIWVDWDPDEPDSDLYISYSSPEDRKFLQDLYFRFSVAHPPQGGAN